MPVAIVSIPASDPDRHGISTPGKWDSPCCAKADGAGNALDTASAPDGGATIPLVTWFDSLRPGGRQGLLAVDDVDVERARPKAPGVAISAIGGEPWEARRQRLDAGPPAHRARLASVAGLAPVQAFVLPFERFA